jgi:hypothetical protein
MEWNRIESNAEQKYECTEYLTSNLCGFLGATPAYEDGILYSGFFCGL